jgi:hypothetical protein
LVPGALFTGALAEGLPADLGIKRPPQAESEIPSKTVRANRVTIVDTLL